MKVILWLVFSHGCSNDEALTRAPAAAAAAAVAAAAAAVDDAFILAAVE